MAMTGEQPEMFGDWGLLTRDWVNAAVSRMHPGAEVGKVDLIWHDKGNNCRARLALHYDAGSGPKTLFAKAEGDFREIHAENGNLFNEPDLFRSNIEIPIAHPKPYAVEIDRERLDWIVLMEDVTTCGGAPLTSESTMTLDQVTDGVLGLARLHGRFWNVETVPELRWLKDWTPDTGFIRSLEPGVVRGLERAKGLLPPGLEKYDTAASIDGMVRAMRSFTTGPQTLLHGDAHIGNSFLVNDDAVGLLDWQVARAGNWSQDLGYFFVSALSIEDRQAHEERLLALYSDALEAPAASRPSIDEVRARYSTSMAFALPIWLSTFSASLTQSPAGALALTQRYAQAYVDLNTAAALETLGA